MSALDATLRFVAAHGLPGQRPAPSAVTAATVEEVIAAARVEKVMGLLDQAVADGAVPADPTAGERIGEEAIRTQAWSLLVERHHLAVHHLLTGADIETRFLKGPSMAHRFYDHPALRPFVDVDVLVHAADLDRAVAVLAAEGHLRRQPEISPGFSARYGKSVTMLSPAGIEVDLHRVLASGPYGLVRPPDALWAAPAEALAIGGVDLPVLDAGAALVHAGVHAVTGAHTRLLSLRDVAQLAHRVDAAAQLAADLRVTACVARAAQMTAHQLQLDPGPPLSTLAGWPIGRRDRRWLTGYERHQQWGAAAVAAVEAIPGFLPKARYAAALVRARLRRP